METRIFAEGSTHGFLHVPLDATGDGLVLTHGAGSNCQSPLLIAVANAFAAIGFHVLRCDLAFRRLRRFGPPAPAQGQADREGLAGAVSHMRGIAPGRIVLGGHSYGGRQASMLCAEDAGTADALLLLSYPLHPPKKANQLRVAHFPNLRIPALFVHGTKDPFGSVEEMRSAIEAIPARTELSVIEGAGHDLAKGQFDIDEMVIRRIRLF